MRIALLLIGILMVGQQPPPNLPPANRVTDPARPDVGYNPWVGTELTVVVVFGADCQPCEQSIAFYKRLATHPAIDRKTGRFVVLSEGGIWPVIDLFEKHPQGFKPDRVVSYPSDDRFGLKTVPTVFVFDGAYKRRGEWRGRLTAPQETEVLALIDTIAADAKKARRR